jgi:hypothetical protein
MRRRPAALHHPAPAPTDPVDPWVALLSPTPPAPPRRDEGPPTYADALALARADAARRVAARLVDRWGRPVRVLATVRRGDDLAVVLSADAAPPPGWSSLGGGRLLVPIDVDTAALVAGVVDELADPAPALLELDGVSVDVVAVGTLAVTAGAATVATVRRLLAHLLRAPGALGLDVLVSGLDGRCLPRLPPDSPGRLHAPIDADALVPLARSLAGTEEPVVVVAPAGALGALDLAALTGDDVGVVLVGTDAPEGGWSVTIGPGGAPCVGVSGGAALPIRAAP